MKKGKRAFRAPDGTVWGLDVRARGASNAMVVFHHPDPSTSRLNRYAWYLSRSPEARDVRNRLDPAEVLRAITDEQLAMLFRRSMPVSTSVPGPGLAVESADRGIEDLSQDGLGPEGLGGALRREIPNGRSKP